MEDGQGRAGTPHPRWPLAPAHSEAPPIQGAWQEFPSSPGEGGWGWEGGWGLGLVRAAGGRERALFPRSWKSQVAARTIFSSPGGGRGAAGRDEIELVGGEREESRSIRTQAAVPSSNAIQCGVWGSAGVVGAASSRCLGAVRSTDQSLFPSEPVPLLMCPAQPPTSQPGPACCADLTSAKSGDSRGH